MAKRKKKKRAYTYIKLFFALTIVAALAWYFTSLIFKPNFVHYPAFGIDIPVNYKVHGIDVSKHQKNISWEDVKQMNVNNIKISFAFIKATEGYGNVDEQFRRNWLFAKKQAIARGAYHFFIAPKSGKLQAQNFIETVQLQKGDLPPVLDIEQAYGAPIAVLQQHVADWLNAVEKEYGIKPIIYTNVDFYNRYLSGKFDDYPLWVAHYLVKDKPRIQRSWIFWQHNESGHVNGIGPYVDFNVFKGDSAAFELLKIK
ncbi:MAG: glycoside hydrolase family 25 protein [Bacteroidetes bacterium]|nr:glycoside hydrolase family 25 protein [Bacteroidota bacterium]MBS1757655.1 glycoside hydrolase family 25 protein [Bacteroidota bacterium]